MTKKNVLWVGIIGTVLISSLLIFGSYSCHRNEYCNIVSDFINQDNLTIIFIMPFVLFFSLITYKMREEVFQNWWRFARWFVPVIMLVTFLIYSQHQGGGMGISGAISSGFNDLIIGIFYVIFIAVSSTKIILAYRSKK